jgi:hypothetical protein
MSSQPPRRALRALEEPDSPRQTRPRSLRGVRARGCCRRDADPAALVSSLLAVLLGRILPARTKRDVASLRSTVTVMVVRVDLLSTDGERA